MANPEPMAETCPVYLCVDFGGTKIAAGVVDTETGRVLARATRSTPVEAGSAGGLTSALAACQEILDQSSIPRDSIAGIGISFGGPVSPDGSAIVRSMHVKSWENISLPEIFSRQFGLPAVMANDANAAALAEWRYGAGRGATNLFYAQLSTGVGSGLILHNQLYRGEGGAGEFGHVVVDRDGPDCVCGNRGCLESIAAGWALARDGQALLSFGEQGDRADAKFVVDEARGGNAIARGIVARAFSAVGQSLASVINLLDPGLVIVGGGIAAGDDLLLPWLAVELDRHVLPHLRNRTVLKSAELGTDGPLVGAAVVAEQRRHDTSPGAVTVRTGLGALK